MCMSTKNFKAHGGGKESNMIGWGGGIAVMFIFDLVFSIYVMTKF